MDQRHDPIAVIGLGRIGLALAGFLLERGFEVIGCDVDPSRLRELTDGEIARSEPGLLQALSRGIGDGRLRTTEDAAAAARSARTVLVIVPVHAASATEIDLRALEAVARSVVPALRPSALLIVETTVPVGTTRRLFHAPLRELGADVGVAYSPERVSVGHVFRDLRTYPKVVGGADAAAAERAAAFYRDALGGAEVRNVASLETAEFVKLVETTYRFVNIALANEFALAAEDHGIDVSVAIEAANSQPYSHIHAPGVGVGGGCIPVYPHLYEAGAPSATLIHASRSVNDGMVEHVIGLLRSALGPLSGRSVLLLGVAFRAGVKDSANSPALQLAGRLQALGASVTAVDPLFTSDDLAALDLRPGDAGAHHDAAVLVTAHPEFLDIRLFERVRPQVVVDGRDALQPAAIAALGIRYLGIGRPPS